MGRLAVNCLLLLCITIHTTTANERPKRDLAFFQNLLSSTLFGRSQPPSSDIPTYYYQAYKDAGDTNEVIINAAPIEIEHRFLPGPVVPETPIVTLVNCKYFNKIRALDRLNDIFSTITTDEKDKALSTEKENAVQSEIRIDLPVYSAPIPIEKISPLEVKRIPNGQMGYGNSYIQVYNKKPLMVFTEQGTENKEQRIIESKPLKTNFQPNIFNDKILFKQNEERPSYSYNQLQNGKPVFSFIGNNQIKSELTNPNVNLDGKHRDEMKATYSYKQLQNNVPVMVFTGNNGPDLFEIPEKIKSGFTIQYTDEKPLKVNEKQESRIGSKYSYKLIRNNDSFKTYSEQSIPELVQESDKSGLTMSIKTTNGLELGGIKTDKKEPSYSYKQLQDNQPVKVYTSSKTAESPSPPTLSKVTSPTKLNGNHINSKYSYTLIKNNEPLMIFNGNDHGITKAPLPSKSVIPGDKTQHTEVKTKYSYTQLKNKEPVMVFNGNTNSDQLKETVQSETDVKLSAPINTPLEIDKKQDKMETTYSYKQVKNNQPTIKKFGSTKIALPISEAVKSRAVIKPLNTNAKLKKEPSHSFNQGQNKDPVIIASGPTNNLHTESVLPMPIKKRIDEVILLGAIPDIRSLRPVLGFPSLEDSLYSNIHIIDPAKDDQYLTTIVDGAVDEFEIKEEKPHNTVELSSNLKTSTPKASIPKNAPPANNINNIEVYQILGPIQPQYAINQNIAEPQIIEEKNTKGAANAMNVIPNKISDPQTVKPINYSGGNTVLNLINQNDINNVKTNINSLGNEHRVWYFVPPVINEVDLKETSPTSQGGIPKINSNAMISNAFSLVRNPIVVPDNKINVYGMTSNDGTLLKPKENENRDLVDQDGDNDNKNIVSHNVPQNHWYFVPPFFNKPNQEEKLKENIVAKVTATASTFTTPKPTIATKPTTKMNSNEYSTTSPSDMTIPDAKTYVYKQKSKDGSSMNFNGNKSGVSVNLNKQATPNRGDIPADNI